MALFLRQRIGAPGKWVQRTAVFVPFLGGILAGTPVSAVTVEEAVRTALETNPDVGIVAENRRAVGYELEQARAGYRPRVDVTSSTGYQWTNDTTTRARSNVNNGKKYVGLPRYELGMTLSQMLFDGYATDGEVERQKSRLISASRRVRETSELIGLDAIEAYLEALRQRELTSLAEDNVALHQENVELVQKKAAGGAATVADVQQAQSRLASSLATLEESKSRLRDADTTYSRIIGERPKDLNRPTPPSWALPKSVDVGIYLALQNNATISVTKADLDTSVKEFQGTNSSFWPTVNLELAGNASRNVDGTRGGDYDASALVTMNYNLFNGNADINRRNEFIARIAEARQRYNRIVRVTEEEMRLAWNALESARERARVQRREVEANDTVSRTYRQQFDLGGRNLLELLDAENELFLSKGNLVTTEYLEIFAVYRILSNAGILLSVLDVAPVGDAENELDPIDPVEFDQSKRPPEEAPGQDAAIDILDPDADILDPDADILDPEADILDPDADILDPDADILDPDADILDPDADLLDPNADILDPNADLLDPDADILDPNSLIEEEPPTLRPVPKDGLDLDNLETLDPNQDMPDPEARLRSPSGAATAKLQPVQEVPYGALKEAKASQPVPEGKPVSGLVTTLPNISEKVPAETDLVVVPAISEIPYGLFGDPVPEEAPVEDSRFTGSNF